jgi:hypothetical protein
MRLGRVFVLVLCFSGQRLQAQTVDWARVTMGLSVGLHAGSSLWDVVSQPVLSSNMTTGNPPIPYPPDLYHLHRDIRAGFTLAAQGTFFSSPRFGVTFELTYLGLGLSDACTVAHDGGDPALAQACEFVGSSQTFAEGITPGAGYHPGSSVDHSASATLIEGGVVLRPFKPAALQPFFKGMIGFATTPHSTIEMESIYGAIADTTQGLIIYQDYTPPAVRPVFTLGAGMTTAPSSGLQFHVEARETFLPLAVVTGPTISQNLQPPNTSVLKGFFSLLVGFDIVLQRERGKRY